jgi:deoxyadenosine/deoxycytidine kinase
MSNFTTHAKKAKIISIEGNIGSGKSTLLERLKKEYADNKGVVFLDEPVSCWNTIKDKEGVTMLEKFYSDQDRYSFPFQMMAYISRLAVMKDAIKSNPGKVFVTERCLYTDKYVFAKMLFDSGKIEDVNYQIYNKWFDTFTDEFTIKKIVYVHTNPDVAHKRTQIRNRNGESSISLEYLQGCHTYHNDMMTEMDKYGTDVVTLNGNIDIYENPEELNMWLSKIDDVVNENTKSND